MKTIGGYRRYIERAKEFGFNVMRSHSDRNERPAEFMDLCDELGLFLWPEFQPDPEKLPEMLAPFWNHPCVPWWCWGNELSQDDMFPWASRCYGRVKQLDPSRMIMDNSGLGAWDRPTTDMLSHHMGYYFPHGRNVHMYQTYAVLTCEEPVSGQATSDLMQTMRDGTFDPGKPMLAHETGNHQIFPDINARLERMNFCRRDKLVEKVKADRREQYLAQWIEGSTKFKLAMDRLWMEQVRKSSIVEGFEMWMLADHGNVFSGLIEDGENCRIKPGVDPETFRAHNRDDILLANFPDDNLKRVFMPGDNFEIELLASIYGPENLPAGEARWSLLLGEDAIATGSARVRGTTRGQAAKLGCLRIEIPAMESAHALQLKVELSRGEKTLSNVWNIWCFPEIEEPPTENIRVTRGLTDDVLQDLAAGKNVLLILEETAAYAVRREVFQSVLARFRPQIWEWGHNLGAYIPVHPAFDGFPHEGFGDLQFFNLIEKGRKIILDRCPLPIDPIVHAVDLPMMTYSEEIYSRIGAYLFELQIAAGKLLVTGFNFTEDAMRNIEVRTLYVGLLRYLQSAQCRPALSVQPEKLRELRDWMLLEVQPSPRLSPEPYWEQFYTDTELNTRDRFCDRGEPSPVIHADPGDLDYISGPPHSGNSATIIESTS